MDRSRYDADEAVSRAILQKTSESLSGTMVRTGNTEFDATATAAQKSCAGINHAKERWGDAGVNYLSNLVRAGKGAIAAVLQTLPSFARSVIVAEQNMRTMTLTKEMQKQQASALAQDLQNPFVMGNANRRARLQAENAVMRRLTMVCESVNDNIELAEKLERTRSQVSTHANRPLCSM